jgi:hypothetical protein
MEVSGQLDASAALILEKEAPVPIEYEAGLVPESIWTLWNIKKKFVAPAGN